MTKHLTKYQKGGIVAFIVLAICVSVAIYKNGQTSEKVKKAANNIATLTYINEKNRYENCIVANKAISQLNLQGSILKETNKLAYKGTILKAQTQSGAIKNDTLMRAEKYKENSQKLQTTKNLNCIKP